MADAAVFADDPLSDLRTQWQQLVSPDEHPMDSLVQRHRERHRRYHNVQHVVAVVRHVTTLATTETVDDLGVVVAAAWYHDAVYEPRSSSNERASARLATRDLARLGWVNDRVETAAAMIEATAHHTEPVCLDAAVLFDADLAILGSDSDMYASYVSGVRGEYAHIDDEAWVSGRTNVLQSFLTRSHIYATASGADRWESAARANLTAELDSLG
ncbi:MAG: hypothetical protein AB8G14_04370 [Ilumatobacter sp.]